jgi:gas vesicle protein
LAFLAGATAGALVALLAAPEAGSDMRHRIRRGARTAREEFTDLAMATREAVGALSQDARQTLRRTASRFNAAVTATKDALKVEGGPGNGSMHHGRS